MSKYIFFDRRDRVISSAEDIFPKEILDDDSLYYHGTTSYSMHEIDANGFLWSNKIYNLEDVKKVISIFTTMGWYGLGCDAFGALRNYTLNVDFKSGENKPVFFSKYPGQAAGYTVKERAGGETSGCLLYAISNLLEFISNEEVRDEFREHRYRSIINPIKGCIAHGNNEGTVGGVILPEDIVNIDPKKCSASECIRLAQFVGDTMKARVAHSATYGPEYQPWDININWLAEEVKSLQPLYDRLISVRDSYEYGVIYAVKIKEHDIKDITNRNTGLAHGYSIATLSKENIVAKAIVGEVAEIVTDDYMTEKEAKKYLGW